MPTLIACLFFTLCLFPSSVLSAENEGLDNPKQGLRILVINSFYRNLWWENAFDQGFEDGFRGSSRQPDVFYEYLDTNRISSAGNLYFKTHLQQRYQGTNLDIIVGESLPAVDFLNNNPDLLSGIPRLTVQTGAEGTGVQEIGLNYRLSIGTNYQNSFLEMLRLVDPKRVYVIVDTLSPGGAQRLASFKKAVQQSRTKVPVEYLPLDTMANMERRVATLPSDSAVYYLLIFRDSAGEIFTPYQAAARLADVSSVPVFSYWDTLLGSGIVGGYVSSGRDVGILSAQFALKISNRETLSLNKEDGFGYFYDWRQLEHWNIDRSRLPGQAHILYRQPSVYEKYRTEIIIITIAFLALFFLVLYLIRNVQSRKKVEKSLKNREDHLNKLIRYSPVGLALCRMDGSLVSVNPAYANIIGYSIEEVLQLSFWDITPEKYTDLENFFLKELAANGRCGPVEKEYRHKDGHLVPVRLNGMILFIDDEKFIWASVEDVSALKEAEKERHHLEDQLQQSRKMEALGTLAGGIAHDFNNILSGISGFAELALLDSVCGPENRKNFEKILAAAGRAKDLVRQILLFSRKDQEPKSPVSFDLIIAEAVGLLKKSIPQSVVLTLDIDHQTGMVLANATQLHQVVMNLATNAYQALTGETGEIRISLRPADLDQATAAKHPPLKGGHYARLTVADSGEGMTPEVMSRMFDPFFTTKEKGKGTGMGLSVVHGIIHSHGGAIWAKSTVGKGTTMHVLIPLYEKNE